VDLEEKKRRNPTDSHIGRDTPVNDVDCKNDVAGQKVFNDYLEKPRTQDQVNDDQFLNDATEMMDSITRFLRNERCYSSEVGPGIYHELKLDKALEFKYYGCLSDEIGDKACSQDVNFWQNGRSVRFFWFDRFIEKDISFLGMETGPFKGNDFERYRLSDQYRYFDQDFDDQMITVHLKIKVDRFKKFDIHN
jgi:hypothetical protein